MMKGIFFSSADIGSFGGKAPCIHSAMRSALRRAPRAGTSLTPDTFPLK
jgi:hypothetical protein